MKNQIALASLLLAFVMACTPIAALTAIQIPGTYDVTFGDLQIQIGGAALAPLGKGIYGSSTLKYSLNFEATGCLQSGQPPANTICMCEAFNICPHTSNTAVAKVDLPNLDKSANNKITVDLTIPGSTGTTSMEGLLDGRKLDLLIGLQLTLQVKKVGNLQCLTVAQSDVKGQGELLFNEFQKKFTGRVRAVWASGCAFGSIVLGGALTLERSFTATRR